MTAAVFNALGDPSRLEMVSRLSRLGPLNTNALTADLGISRQAAARHLAVLDASGVVRTLRQGRVALRELDPEVIAGMSVWMSQIATAWDAHLSNLKSSYE